MPRYAALIYSPPVGGPQDPEAWAAAMAEYGAFIGAAQEAGVFVSTEALQPVESATTVRVSGGKGGDVTTSDGPFAETKEVLGGFFLLDCANQEEAAEWASRIPGAWHGCVEVRPVIDFGGDPGAGGS